MIIEAAIDHQAAQRRTLRLHRLRATGLLLLMAGVFIATRFVPDPGWWLLLVRAGAEAALVGGLADWFAVTALFRRPLGLPIPHTALVPRQKDRLAAGLASFMERNFLAPDVVVQKLRTMNVAAMLAGWAARRDNAEALAGRIVAGVPIAINSVQDREIRRLIRRTLNAQLAGTDLAPIVGRILRLLTENGHHQMLFDQALVVARQLVAEHRQDIYDVVGERSKWWIPRTIDRRVAGALVEGMIELLGDLAAPEHPARRRFDAAAADLIEKFEHDPAFRDRTDAVKRQLLGNPIVQDYLESVWDEFRRLLVRDANAPNSRLTRALAGAIASLGEAVAADPAMQERLNIRIEGVVTRVVLPWRREIGQLITDVVRRWDARTVTERIELEVGRDLQFIRINGTLVGALVGCALFVFSTLVFE